MSMTGSCLCGKIQYAVTDKPDHIGYCHCKICQKSHGASCSAFAGFLKEHFAITSGTGELTYFQSSENVRRSFCKTCGSKISFEMVVEKFIWISAGSLDFDPGMKASSHIFVNSKAPWHDITDDLTQYAEGP